MEVLVSLLFLAGNYISSSKNSSSNSRGLFNDPNSPILTSNVLLLADQKQHSIAPQGSQSYDWSKRQKFKNRFRLYKSNPTTKSTTTTTTTTTTKVSVTETPSTTPQPPPEVYETTEVHVVTSLSDEIGVSPTLETSTTPVPTMPISPSLKPVKTTPISIQPVRPSPSPTAGSYQFISIGTPIAKDNVLELERLFLGENLQPEQDSNKIKRKVSNSNGFFFQVNTSRYFKNTHLSARLSAKKHFLICFLFF